VDTRAGWFDWISDVLEVPLGGVILIAFRDDPHDGSPEARFRAVAGTT
jgi:hypothetical protein